MAQSSGRERVVGDYLVGKQIGSGSYSVVWHAKHLVHGTEVAIKEIITGKLNKKLQESLMSEIFILKTINHPNIIRLHDIIEIPGRIHIVLEYCKGGDLSMYIQKRGRVPEAIAKHFMQQLAAGLQVLRDNNLIHRDLKPQNLLLSSTEYNAVLKIADFGFARSLQPRGLAETLCGSPLYMAPEIMQLQKYDAKADLWSVGAILFQLVAGVTPFTGNNQIQLLQNIVRSTELQFPPSSKDLSDVCKDLCQKLLRRNPVERLTFEEFFNHPFLTQRNDEIQRSKRLPRPIGGISFPESRTVRNTDDTSLEDCLHFFLEGDSSGPDGSPSFSRRKFPVKSTHGFSLNTRVDRREETFRGFDDMGCTSRLQNFSHNLESNNSRHGFIKDDGCKEHSPSISQRVNTISGVADSLELIDQDYVFVSGPPLDMSSSSTSTCKPDHKPKTSMSSIKDSMKINPAPSPPMPMVGTGNNNIGRIGSLETPVMAPEISNDCSDSLEQPSTDCMTRIKSLQQCASAIAELVEEKIEERMHLEAFAIQLVILAIWKQALHICHTQAASAIEGSPSQEHTRLGRSSSKSHGTSVSEDFPDIVGPQNILSQIESQFLKEVERAEELAKAIEPGSTEMPDAMETIFQSALALGRHGGVDELLGKMEKAAFLYSKAVRLLVFLLVEAPSLIVNPPFSLTSSDRYRLRNYIEILNDRQGYSRSQRMAALNCDDQLASQQNSGADIF